MAVRQVRVRVTNKHSQEVAMDGPVGYLVCSKVSQFEVEVPVQHTVLRLDVAMEDSSLVEVHHSQQCLCEVVAG